MSLLETNRLLKEEIRRLKQEAIEHKNRIRTLEERIHSLAGHLPTSATGYGQSTLKLAYTNGESGIDDGHNNNENNDDGDNLNNNNNNIYNVHNQDRKYHNVTQEDRERIKDFLLGRFVNEELQYGAITEAAKHFNVARSTISRLWKTWCKRRSESTDGSWDVSSGKKTNGAPRKHNRQDIIRRAKELPPEDRATIRKMATKLGLAHTTFHGMLRKEKIFHGQATATSNSLSLQVIKAQRKCKDNKYDLDNVGDIDNNDNNNDDDDDDDLVHNDITMNDNNVTIDYDSILPMDRPVLPVLDFHNDNDIV